MNSLVIKIAILVNRVVLPEIITPAPGLINPIVEVPEVEPVQTSISLIFNITFVFLKLLYFSDIIHYQCKDSLINSHDRVSQFDNLSFQFHHLLFFFQQFWFIIYIWICTLLVIRKLFF